MWELAEGEIDCQLETSKDIIPYSGDTFTMNVKSNTSWKVSTPVWMTANPSEGTGSGVVTIDVASSTESQQRNGKISVMFSSDPDNNIAGELSKEMYVKQEAYWESVRVTISEACIRTHKYPNVSKYDAGYSVTYTVESDLPDDEFKKLVSGTHLQLRYLIADVWTGRNYEFRDYYYLIPDINMSRGTHTVSNDKWIVASEHKISAHSSTCVAEIACRMYGKDIKFAETRIENIEY